MEGAAVWENEARTIVRYTYSGVWNWDDFYTILESRDPEVPSNEQVTVLLDFREITRFPSDAVLHLKRAAQMAQETEELIILITNSASLITLYNIFVRMYSSVGKRFRLVKNDEEAYAILQMHPKNEQL